MFSDAYKMLFMLKFNLLSTFYACYIAHPIQCMRDKCPFRNIMDRKIDNENAYDREQIRRALLTAGGAFRQN